MSGDIERDILLCLAKNEKWLDRNDISEQINRPYQTIKNKLNDLKNILNMELNIVKKEINRGKGKKEDYSDGYCLKKTIDAFKGISSYFLREPEWSDFYMTPYCKNMITPSLLREIEKDWNITEPYESKKEIENHKENFQRHFKEGDFNNITNKDYEYSLSAKIEFNTYFTEEDVLEILQLSPTALKQALDGAPVEGVGGCVGFQEMLLTSIIFDSNTRHYPGYQFKLNLSIEILKPGVKATFVKSAVSSADHDIFNGKPIIKKTKLLF